MWDTLTRVAGAAPARRPREFAAGLDLVRSTGPRYLAQRRREAKARVGREDALAVYRKIWRDAAQQEEASFDDLGSGLFELKRGAARTRAWFNWVELEDIVTHRLALDKTRVHGLLVAAGLPVPDYIEFDFRDLRSAERFLRDSRAPCVVKPARGTSAGHGVTSGVETLRGLERARLRASRGDSRLLIERQVPGIAHRLLLLDGELLDTVRRHPPEVLGDGRSKVRELIAAENRRRLDAGGFRGFRHLTVDLDALLTLEAQGIDLGSVPEDGRKVTIKRVESQNASEENETVRTPVSSGLLDEIVTAVEAVGLRLAGVDVVAPDLTRPLCESGGAIIEVNGTPGFQYHYLVAEPERATRIAGPILRKLLAERSP